MPAFIPDIGEQTLLNWIASVMEGAPAGKDVFLRLYINNYTPVSGSVAGDFTEANYKGYTAGGVQLSAWTPAAADGDFAIIAADQVSFLYDSGEAGNASEDVYGAYLVDEDGNLLQAELFDGGPFEMSNDTHEIKYTAKFRLAEITEACA